MANHDDKSNNQVPQYGQDRPRNYDDEEYGSEIVPERRETGNEETVTVYGWIGIVLSFLSFLIWPLLFAASGIILGFVSRSKGADTLGNIAIGIGVLSIIVRLFI
jgi:hypothetical protein